MPDVLRPFRILLPNRAGDRFGVLLVLYAPLPGETALADIAFVFPIPFPVGGGITENLVLRAQDTAVGLFRGLDTRIGVWRNQICSRICG